MPERVQQSPDMRGDDNRVHPGPRSNRSGPTSEPDAPQQDDRPGPGADKVLAHDLETGTSQVGRSIGPVQVGTDSEEGALMDHERDRDPQEEEQSAVAGSQDGGRSGQGGKFRSE